LQLTQITRTPKNGIWRQYNHDRRLLAAQLNKPANHSGTFICWFNEQGSYGIILLVFHLPSVSLLSSSE
jgi:hypothetical protein